MADDMDTKALQAEETACESKGWTWIGFEQTANVQAPGKPVTFTAKTGGDNSGILYKFVLERDEWTDWYVVQEPSTNNCVTISPDEPGNYNLYCDVINPDESYETFTTPYYVYKPISKSTAATAQASDTGEQGSETSENADAQADSSEPADEPIIVIDNVSMMFNIASEQLSSLKEYFISLMRRQLFFKKFMALENISFTVNRGDVYGIVGTNGSGKSTLLKLVAGVMEPTEGTVTIDGSIAPLIELGAGFDFELTARENIYLNGALLGYSRKFINEHFDDIVEFAEVREFLDMPMKNYSSGMVARVAFSIATTTIPDILVVDEALSVGDFLFQEKCERRIDELVNEHNTTLLFVSHSIDQVERVCKKAVWIEKGHMRMQGPVEEVCEAYRKLGQE